MKKKLLNTKFSMDAFLRMEGMYDAWEQLLSFMHNAIINLENFPWERHYKRLKEITLLVELFGKNSKEKYTIPLEYRKRAKKAIRAYAEADFKRSKWR